MILFRPRGDAHRTLTLVVFSLVALLGNRIDLRGGIIDTGDVVPGAPAGTGSVASPFRVGNTDIGTLTVNGGSVLTVTGAGNMFVGDAVDGIGIVHVTGSESGLVVNSSIIVGDQGTGMVTVDERAKFTIDGDSFLAGTTNSFADVSISGLGAIWDNVDDMAIGDRGRAIVEISSGGRLFSDTNDIGNSASGDGRVTVTGPLSLWRTTGPLQVGDFGRGRLQVFDQARVESTFGIVGANVGAVGAVEIDGEGSLWTPTGFLTIGYFGRGSLTITGGGRVVSHDTRIGDEVGAIGAVTVDGAGSTWNVTGILNVSEPGEAHLAISNGALVTSAGVVTVAAQGIVTLSGGRLDANATGGLVNQGVVRGSGTIHGAKVDNSTALSEIRVASGDQLRLTGTLANAGRVDVDGGALEILKTTTNTSDINLRDGALLRFGGDGLVNNEGARLAVTGGAADIFGAIDNNAGAQIIVGGRAAAVFHDALENDGQFFIQPGGEVLLLDDLTFSAGATLGVQLAQVDLAEGEGDPSNAIAQVQVGGDAALGGTLEVDLIGEYSPLGGDTFQILTTAGGITGSFSTATLPALASGLSWNVLYDADSVTLAVIGAALAGDYNQNGVVDAADYTLWRDTLGETVSIGTGADGDGDGMIDDGDYTVWKTNFGATIGGGGATGSAISGATGSASADAAIPEPASTVLLCLGLASLAMTARSRSRGIDW